VARIEWVEQRLRNWALWHERAAGGGLGFASQASFLKEAASGRRESHVPCDEVEAGVTDKAVASIKDPHPHLFDTLTVFYLEGRGISGSAAARRCAVSTIHAHLAQADAYLARWFTERKQQQAAALAAREEAIRSATR